jgi:ATP synthase protein I
MDEKDRKLFRTLGVLSTVGISMVAATVIGLYLGLKLDEWLGTAPWFTAIFVVIGIIAGFRNLFYYAKKGQDALDQDERKGKHD